MNKKLFKESKFRLNSVQFKAIDTNSDDEANIYLNVTDNYSVLSEENYEIRVLYTREVTFKPESIFNLSVNFDIIFTLDESTESFNVLNLKDMINKTVIVSYASKIIADITSTGGNLPLITETHLVDAKQD